MKLYTEEQVKEAIMMARITQGVLATTFFCDEHEVFEKLTPIELPSDEEIEKEFTAIFAGEEYKCYDMVEGAQWMRDKIQGGNNDKQ
jgi:hypothetical protein